MHDIGSANQIPQVDEIGLADNFERKGQIVKFLRWSLRRERDFEFQISASRAQPGEATRQRQNDRFDAADTRRKEMRIDEQLHSRSFSGPAGEVGAPLESGSAAPGRGFFRETAFLMASNVAATFSRGDHVVMRA